MPDRALHRIAVLPGDGIGPEVVGAAWPLVVAAADGAGARLEPVELDWGADHHLRHGRPMPPDAVDTVRGCDAVLFGAVGRPDVPDHVLVRGLIIALRQSLDLSVNLRPVRSWPGVPTPLRNAEGIDLVVVRENTEGEYLGAGGRAVLAGATDVGIEVAVHSGPAIERAARHAFELAAGRRRHLTLATKSNAMRYGYTLWDEVVARVAAEHPEVRYDVVLVDAMAAALVQRPRDVDVLLAGNLFGDILSDLAAVFAGGLGMAPSGNVSTAPGVPGIFEPVHGSAPDIAGRGIANPCAAILSGALMLDHLDLPAAGEALRQAVAGAVAEPASRTPDLGGRASTTELADAVRAQLSQARSSRARSSHASLSPAATGGTA